MNSTPKPRILKAPKKYFREYNIRQRGMGKPEVSFEEFLSLGNKYSTDFSGKIHPKIKEAEKHMQEVFGDYIFSTINECIKCKHRKPLVDFICRYNTKKIENICKECDRARRRKKKQPGAIQEIFNSTNPD